jgi:hypothetical protein
LGERIALQVQVLLGGGHTGVSVKDGEEITGFTFFDKVLADIITPLKDEVDAEFIPVLAREH